MKQLEKVPARYRPLVEHIFSDYAQPVLALEHEHQGASLVFEVDVDRGEPLCWHCVLGPGCEILEGRPDAKRPTLLHVQVNAERLRTAMESGASIREIAYRTGAKVQGDIDYAFRVLAAAEKVRAARPRKGA